MATPVPSAITDCRVPTGRRSAELGLASFLMGALLFLASPITAVLAVLVWRFADTGPQVVLLHAWLARLGVLIGVLVGLASIMSGLRAMRFARQRRQPAGMVAAGLFLALLGSGAWAVASIALRNTTESLLCTHGR